MSLQRRESPTVAPSLGSLCKSRTQEKAAFLPTTLRGEQDRTITVGKQSLTVSATLPVCPSLVAGARCDGGIVQLALVDGIESEKPQIAGEFSQMHVGDELRLAKELGPTSGEAR